MDEQILITGTILFCTDRDKLIVLEEGVLLVDKGKILRVGKHKDYDQIKHLISEGCKRIELSKDEFLCPGLIDTHLHAPQFPNIGLGYDMPLLEWLNTYTFALEKKYSDIKFASDVYRTVVETTISSGTTTACYYATIHTKSAILLAKIVNELGQRALIGKVNMNQYSPDDYVEKCSDSLTETEYFIKEIKNIKNPLVQPAVTPRFAVSCDMKLLTGLGVLAKKYDCYIQTHISENKSEIELVKKLFPDCPSYADVYDRAGLLTNKTILGHGVYLTEEEKELLSLRGSSVAHCPNSNTLLQSGNCCLRELWKAEVKVGLGTDIAGGCNPSIIDAMRCALVTSIQVSFDNEKLKPINYVEAFYLATLGGAEALGMEDTIGSFEVGKDFDALIVSMKKNERTGIIGDQNPEALLQKFIYVGDDRNVKQVYVKGRLVKS